MLIYIMPFYALKFQHVLPKRNIMQVTCVRASLVAQLVTNPPAIEETWVRSLGWDNSPEKGKATHSNVLAWRIPWTA